MNNADFIDGLRNQDPDAAKHLSECFVPTVWRFVYLRVDGDRHLAEDIVSDSVLALIAAISQGIDIQYPSAWLRCVAQRKMQDHFRAAARVQHLIQQAGSSMDASIQETPATEHDKRVQREEVRAAVDRLPEPYRLALEWKYIDRLSVREIARRLDATEKSVESILFRARKSFRGELRKEDQADSRTSAATPQSTQGDDDEDGTDIDEGDDKRRPAFTNEMTRTKS